MIKYFSILLLLAFTATASQAQTPDTVWHLVNSALPANLTAMSWTTTDTGFFLTQQSDLFLTLTTDGGINFTTSKFPDSIVHIKGAVSHWLTFEQIAGGMSWPSKATGYIGGVTTSDTFGHSAVQTILATHDAGSTWTQYYPTNNDTVIKKADTSIINDTVNVNGTVTINRDTTITPADTVINHELWNNIYFPSDLVGYASTGLVDGSKNYIAKTTDGGKTWINKYESDTLTFKNLNFVDPNNGIFFAQGISLHIGYTTDGGNTFHLTSIGTDSTPYFLHWNSDASWLAGSDSVYRSVDSGKHWAGVIPYDTVGGPAYIGALRDSIGFAFREDNPKVFRTRDYGVSWTSDTLPRIGVDSVQALAVSMPSDSIAYLLAVDPSTTTNLLMKIKIPARVHTGGGNGMVSMAPGASSTFTAATSGNEIIFTAPTAPEQRTIQIMDILGRVCASVSLSSGAHTGTLPMNELRAGGYFARLGNQVVKFTILN